MITEANSLKEFVDEEIAGCFPFHPQAKQLRDWNTPGRDGVLLAGGGWSLTPRLYVAQL